MSIADLQSASEQETSSIPFTSNPTWFTVRSPSQISSHTSPLSRISDHLSDISDIELESTQANHLLSDHIHSHSKFNSINPLPPASSEPSAHLFLPHILKSNSTMTQLNHSVPPLLQMPLRGSKNAPETFKGNYKHVETFIDHYNRLLNYYHVTSEADKCHGILEYCSLNVKDYIQTNPHFLAPNWSQLQKDILNVYDAERMKSRIKPKDFYTFIQNSSQGQITNLSQWKKYHRDYISQAGFLKHNAQLDDLQYHGYYWYGIPKSLRSIIEVRLQAKEPNFDNSQPWPVSLIQSVAEAYFKRTKFTSHLPHLHSLGFEEEEEEEDSDNDSYDSEDSDDYEDRRRHRKYKSKKKKKIKKIKNKSKHESPPTQVRFEEPSRNILPPTQDDSVPVENLIHHLNTMSLDDPQYGKLYYQAVSRDSSGSGLVAQCITRKPIQITPSQQASLRDNPPHQYSSYPRGMLPRLPGMQNTSKCYGCFETGHPLRDCPKMAQMISRGTVTLDPQTLKYRFPDGQPLFRKQEECLMDTITRMRPSALQGTVNFATLSEKVDNFYTRNTGRTYLQRSYSDSEDDEDEYDYTYESETSSEDEYEKGHWTSKFNQRKKNPTYTATVEAYDEDEEDSYEAYHQKCQKQQQRMEHPSYVTYYDSDDEDTFYRSYPAERTEKGKTTRQARDAAMNNPIKKAQLDGVYMPPRRNTRSSEKLSEAIPVPSKNTTSTRQSSRLNESLKGKENIPAIPYREQFPVDAREPRFKEKPDVTMKDLELQSKPRQEEKKTVTLQDHSNRYKPSEDRNPEPNPERTRAGPRQSELSTQVDPKEVVEQILNTPVSLSLGKILGVSKELSFGINDLIRYKNPSAKPAPHATTNQVYRAHVDELDSGIDEPNLSQLRGKELVESKKLIQLDFYCRNNKITALIDTGSQLNVV